MTRNVFVAKIRETEALELLAARGYKIKTMTNKQAAWLMPSELHIVKQDELDAMLFLINYWKIQGSA